MARVARKVGGRAGREGQHKWRGGGQEVEGVKPEAENGEDVVTERKLTIGLYAQALQAARACPPFNACFAGARARAQSASLLFPALPCLPAVHIFPSAYLHRERASEGMYMTHAHGMLRASTHPAWHGAQIRARPVAQRDDWRALALTLARVAGACWLAPRGTGAYDRVAVRLLGSNTPTNFPLWMGERDGGGEEEDKAEKDKGEEEKKAGDADTHTDKEKDVKDEKVESSVNGGTSPSLRKTRALESRL